MRCFLVLCISIFAVIGLSAQKVSPRIGLSNTYVLTGAPVFGLSWEQPVFGSITASATAEFGRYAHSRKNILHASLDSYSVKGVGLLPEVRYYINHHKNHDFIGPFVSVFGRVRRFSELQWDGITVSEKGLTISNPSMSHRLGWNSQLGFAGGFHLGYDKLRLHADIIAGYGWGNTKWSKEAPDANPEITQKRQSMNGGSPRLECSLIFCL